MRHSLRHFLHIPSRNSLRNTALLLLGLSSLLFNSGCSLLNPNSKLNVNRGEYSDEWGAGGVERRASEGMEHEDAEGIDKWWHSPKYRAINRNLGVD